MITSADQIFDDSIPFDEKLNFVYQYQRSESNVYNTFASHFFPDDKITPDPDDIPLLPVRAFKDTKLIAGNGEPQLTFRSSGTGDMMRSSHHLLDPELYKKSIKIGFSNHFDCENSVLLCYTPGYNDNPESSLLWMLNYLIDLSGDERSRFLELNQPLDQKELQDITESGKQPIMFGAAFGLLDLAENHKYQLPENSVIIETGGMKTHRREISKKELRQILSDRYSVPQRNIHSEYGMCELLSQCYAIGSEWFESPSWVNVTIRDAKNPGRVCEPGEEGKIGIIDLANIYSCPFLLTDDRGVADADGQFKVLGRWHTAEMRGCNFLIDRD